MTTRENVLQNHFLSVAFRANWMSARSFCKSNGMDLVAIESEHEEQYFLGKCRENIDLFEEFSHIGGVSNSAKGIESWYWITSVKEVKLNLNLESNETSKEKNCLQLIKRNNKFSYQRTNCFGDEPQSFVCQKVIYKKISAEARKWKCEVFSFLCDL